MSINRFIPSICAGIVLFGCVVPTKGNLITLPQSFHWTEPSGTGPMADMLKNMMAADGMNAMKSGLMTAKTIAYFAYIVPLTAFGVIIANLRGFIPRVAQILVGLTWAVFGIAVPLVAATIGLHAILAMPMMGMLGTKANVTAWDIYGADPGAWIITAGTIAMLLSGVGLLAYRETERVPAPAPEKPEPQ